jgi:hypothetical protein
MSGSCAPVLLFDRLFVAMSAALFGLAFIPHLGAAGEVGAVDLAGRGGGDEAGGGGVQVASGALAPPPPAAQRTARLVLLPSYCTPEVMAATA